MSDHTYTHVMLTTAAWDKMVQICQVMPPGVMAALEPYLATRTLWPPEPPADAVTDPAPDPDPDPK